MLRRDLIALVALATILVASATSSCVSNTQAPSVSNSSLGMIALADGWSEQYVDMPANATADQLTSFAWSDGYHDVSGNPHGGLISYYPGWWEAFRWFTMIHERGHAQGWNRGQPMQDCPRDYCIMSILKGSSVWEKIAIISIERGSWFCDDCSHRLLGL